MLDYFSQGLLFSQHINSLKERIKEAENSKNNFEVARLNKLLKVALESSHRHNNIIEKSKLKPEKKVFKTVIYKNQEIKI